MGSHIHIHIHMHIQIHIHMHIHSARDASFVDALWGCRSPLGLQKPCGAAEALWRASSPPEPMAASSSSAAPAPPGGQAARRRLVRKQSDSAAANFMYFPASPKHSNPSYKKRHLDDLFLNPGSPPNLSRNDWIFLRKSILPKTQQSIL